MKRVITKAEKSALLKWLKANWRQDKPTMKWIVCDRRGITPIVCK